MVIPLHLGSGTMVGLSDLAVEAAESSAVGRRIFAREGILVVRGFFPPAVIQPAAAFLDESLKQVDDLFLRYGLSMRGENASAEVTDLVTRRGSDIPEDHKHLFQGHFPLQVRLSEVLRALARFTNTQPLLFDLLATTRLFAHMPPTARYVLPHCSLAAVPPHQDISYNRHMGDFCVMWVPFVPIDSACGGMAAYRKTNAASEVLTGKLTAEAGGWLPPITSDDLENAERVVLAPLGVGDVVILDRRTIHESMPNQSDRVRLSCDFRFFGEHSHSTKHYLDLRSDTVVPPAQPGS
jgi:hypothetical protein